MPTLPTTAQPAAVPLCVDLDGTVLRSDLFWESFVRLLQRNPLYLFAALDGGAAGAPAQAASRPPRRVPVETLPYTPAFLEYLRAEHATGRPILLVTASDAALAQLWPGTAGLFAEVWASDGRTNLRGAAKARKLVERFGKAGLTTRGTRRWTRRLAASA